MRYASQCVSGSMTVTHWQVDSRRHIIFEATHDIAPGDELHFNYFQKERNRDAVSKQFQLWGGCNCEHPRCRQAQFLPGMDLSSKEVANGALLVSPPIIDVLAQINSFSDDTEIAVNNLGYRFTVVDDDLPSRSMKAWGTSTFLCDDYLNLLTLDFARHTSAGHTTSPVTRACPYWISPCLPQLDGLVFASDDSITQLAASQILKGLLSSSDETIAI